MTTQEAAAVSQHRPGRAVRRRRLFPLARGPRLGPQPASEARVAKLQAYVKFFWEETRTIEIVVEEVAAELGGEAPLRPLLRELLEHSKAGLTCLNRLLEALGRRRRAPGAG